MTISIERNQKIQSLFIYIYTHTHTHKTKKYKRKMCYYQKNNSDVKTFKFLLIFNSMRNLKSTIYS